MTFAEGVRGTTMPAVKTCLWLQLCTPKVNTEKVT